MAREIRTWTLVALFWVVFLAGLTVLAVSSAGDSSGSGTVQDEYEMYRCAPPYGAC